MASEVANEHRKFPTCGECRITLLSLGIQTADVEQYSTAYVSHTICTCIYHLFLIKKDSSQEQEEEQSVSLPCSWICRLSSPGLNRTVVYSLVDSVSGFFSIDPFSGMVTLEKTLDRESRDSYRVRVQATDQAGQQGALSSQVGRKSRWHRFNLSCIFAMLFGKSNCKRYFRSQKSLYLLWNNANWKIIIIKCTKWHY